MTLRPPLFSAKQRLGFALVAALFVHTSLLVFAHFALMLNAIPFESSRILTLTIENTSNEGVLEQDQLDRDTVNNVPVAQPKNVIARDTDGELVSAEALAEEGADLPNKNSPAPGTEVSQTVSAQTAIEASSPLGDETAKDLQSTSIASESDANQRTAPTIDDAAIVTSSNGFLAISSVTGTPDYQIAERVAVTESEQRMLDQKIRYWAENLDSVEDFSEAVSWQEQGQTYVANFSREPASGDMDLDEVVVQVMTVRDGEKLTTEMRMKKLAFSNFGQFVHRWDQNISIHDDEMTGRFHSNTRFNLEYSRRASPRFNDKVTTASSRVNLNGPTSKQNIFLGGLEMGVKRIKMPKPRLLFSQAGNQKAKDEQDNTVYVETSSRLTFTAAGTLEIEPIDETKTAREISLGMRPTYVIASPKARLHVRGTVNGTVAVYSPKQIVIDGDIRYTSFADIDEGGDFLGLVSARNVVIPSRRTTGEGDLTIHAAIYAGRKFKVTQLLGPRSGTLTVHGSVSAGSITATEPRYATNIVFDERLEDVRPPGFPVTDRYELAVAQNGWTRETSEDDMDPEPINYLEYVQQ